MVQFVFDYVLVHISLENLQNSKKNFQQSHYVHFKFANYMYFVGLV